MLKEIISNSLIGDFKRAVHLNVFKRKWRKNNSHNGTIPVNRFDPKLVKVGNYSYGELKIVSFSDQNKVHIGSFVSVAQDVTFVINAEHYLNHISTYPFKVKALKCAESESFSKGDIIVDDDVWIGYGATILSGVHIGQGAVVAAGAVVAEDIPPYAIAGGVPARVIKYRFEPQVVEELLKVDYSRLTKEQIKEHIDDLYCELTDKEQLGWMLKKE